jgi:hypothetical protein
LDPCLALGHQGSTKLDGAPGVPSQHMSLADAMAWCCYWRRGGLLWFLVRKEKNQRLWPGLCFEHFGGHLSNNKSFGGKTHVRIWDFGLHADIHSDMFRVMAIKLRSLAPFMFKSKGATNQHCKAAVHCYSISAYLISLGRKSKALHPGARIQEKLRMGLGA